MMERRRAAQAAGRIVVGAGLLLSLTTMPDARAENAATFAAPGGRWAAWVPGAGCPVSCSQGHGTYAVVGAGVDALRRFAAEHGPAGTSQRYSPGIVDVPITHAESDDDGDGVRDRFLLAHPFLHDFPERRHCSAYADEGVARGWAATSVAVQVYERDPPGRLEALAGEAWVSPATACATHPPGESVSRGDLPVFSLRREPGHACPQGYVQTTLRWPGRGCAHEGGAVPERNLGGRCPALTNGSNPVNAVTGNKYQRELDYAGTARGDLVFERHYNSQMQRRVGLGPGWSHTYLRRLERSCVGDGASAICSTRALRPDGRVLTFVSDGGAWSADPIVVERLESDADGALVLLTADGGREHYGAGVVVGDSTSVHPVARLVDRAGFEHELRYDAAGGHPLRPTAVTGPFGRALAFHYDGSGRLAGITDPAGHRVEYRYDVAGRLGAAIPPDADDVPGETSTRANNPARIYRYDDPRHLAAMTGIVDEAGRRFASWAYDEAGRAISSEHAGGANRVAFEYGAGYTAVTDARGRTRSFNVDVAFGVGLITAVTGSHCNACGAGPRAAVTYDARGFEDRVTDYLGVVTDYDYDAQGLLVRRVEAAGTSVERTIETGWDQALRAPSSVTVLDAAGQAIRRTTTTWRDGRPERRTEEDLSPAASPQRTTRFAYYEAGAGDPPSLHGLLKTIDGPRTDVPDVTSYARDAATGNLVSITNPLGHVTRYAAHDAHGRATRIEGPNGAVTELVYHPRGWLLARIRDGARLRFEYDAAGLLVRVTDPDGVELQHVYDEARRLSRIVDASGGAVELGLDALGNRVSERTLDAEGTLRRLVERTYDEDNRLVEVRRGAVSTTRFEYDDNGALLATFDPRTPGGAAAPLVERHERDERGRIARTIDAVGGVVSRRYDADGHLVELRAPNGAETRRVLNGFGDLVEEHSADAGLVRLAYDEAGNAVRRTDARSVTVSYRYDALNRLTHVDYPTQQDALLVYDEHEGGQNGIGRLTSFSDESGTVRLSYDRRGNLVQRSGGGATGRYRHLFRYTPGDRLARITDPRLRGIDYDYDSTGRVSAVRAQLGWRWEPLVTDVTHAPFGPVERWVHGNGVVMTREHDLDYRLTGLAYAGVVRRAYAYDAANNVVAIEDLDDPTRGERYAYDALSRLVEARGPWGEVIYASDSNGNRTSRTADGVRTTYGYVDATNRLATVSEASAPPSAVTHDAAGNVTGLLGDALSYGEGGRLARLDRGSAGAPLRFLHDALGRPAAIVEERPSRVPGRRDARLEPVNDPAGRLVGAMYSADGGRRRSLLYTLANLGELPVARRYARSFTHLHTDHLGQVIASTDAAGALVSRDSIEPFAGPLRPRSTHRLTPESAYPGQLEVSGAEGLFLNGFRVYDGRIGRYLQSDPIGLNGGINTYAYAANNPLRFLDPLGLYCLSDREINAIAGGFGGAFSGATAGALLAPNPLFGGALLGGIGGLFGAGFGFFGTPSDGTQLASGVVQGAITGTRPGASAVGVVTAGLSSEALQSAGVGDSLAGVVGGGVGGFSAAGTAAFLAPGAPSSVSAAIALAWSSALKGGLSGLSGAALSAAIAEFLRAFNDCKDCN